VGRHMEGNEVKWRRGARIATWDRIDNAILRGGGLRQVRLGRVGLTKCCLHPGCRRR
jgi:hypothetical protein